MLSKDSGLSIHRIPQWYAFFTRPRHEKKVLQSLNDVGIKTYLPLQRSLNKWKDRKKWVETPLFSCYIFSHIPYINRYDVLKIPSVVRIVGDNRTPAPVRDFEIEAIKIFLQQKKSVCVQDGVLEGDSVRIKTGPLSGYEGKFISMQGKRWFVIYISALGKSIMVDVHDGAVEKI